MKNSIPHYQRYMAGWNFKIKNMEDIRSAINFIHLTVCILKKDKVWFVKVIISFSINMFFLYNYDLS